MQSYARNIEAFKKVITMCKQSLVLGKPLGQMPHYWALIPVEPKKAMDFKKNMNHNH